MHLAMVRFSTRLEATVSAVVRVKGRVKAGAAPHQWMAGMSEMAPRPKATMLVIATTSVDRPAVSISRRKRCSMPRPGFL